MLENDAGGGEEEPVAFLFDDPKGESARLRLIRDVDGLLAMGI
jgi:hypothetical protein